MKLSEIRDEIKEFSLNKLDQFRTEPAMRKKILFAISIITFVGALFASFIAVSWTIPLSLFALGLVPLFYSQRVEVMHSSKDTPRLRTHSSDLSNYN